MPSVMCIILLQFNFRTLYHEITRIGNPQIKYLSPFVAPPSYFESDGIHLNAEAGVLFVNYLVTSMVLLFPDSPPTVQNPPSSEDSGLVQLSKSVSDLRRDFIQRRLQDNKF